MSDTPKSDFEMRALSLSQSQNSEGLSAMSNVYDFNSFRRKKEDAKGSAAQPSLEERVRKIQTSIIRINQLIAELKGAPKNA